MKKKGYGRHPKFRIVKVSPKGTTTVLGTAASKDAIMRKAERTAGPFEVQQLELGEIDFDEYMGYQPKRPHWRKVYSKPAYVSPARLPNPPAVTDRALRYRANSAMPESPDVCIYCGAEGPGLRLDAEHINGLEEDTAPDNLAKACRSCNTTKGAFFAAEGIGRLTRQYNPTRPAGSMTEYVESVAALMGRNRSQAPGRAIARIQATPPAARAKYARALRRIVNPEPVPSYEQYAYGVSIHSKGEHDAGGAIIHATPPAKRREYARRLYPVGAAKRRATLAARRQQIESRWD